VVLVGYPILVALLVAVALQGEDRQPSVALVNLDGSGRTVRVGEERLSVDDYVARLEEDVEVLQTGPEAAERALEAGRVIAVLTLPAGFISDLQSGVRQPVLRLVTSRRSPIQADAITRRLQAAVFRLNQRLAATYVEQVLRLTDLVTRGGRIGVFGRSGEALGLGRSETLIEGLQRDLRARGLEAEARRLDPLLDFITATGENLDLARPAANAIASPIRLDVAAGPVGREPLSAFGFAAALLVSLGLVGVLLAAASLSSEREDNVLVRLGRGLVPPWALVLEKMAVAGTVCLGVGLVLLGAVDLLTSLTVGRWAAWLPALALAGLAFGAFGVLVGAAARETRSALLAALMLALPLLFVGLVPGSDAASAASQVLPFGPAFDAFQGLLVEPDLPSDLAATLGRLALVGAVLAAAASVVLARRSRE
jgi:ABC-2 type transport system permease protein